MWVLEPCLRLPPPYTRKSVATPLGCCNFNLSLGPPPNRFHKLTPLLLVVKIFGISASRSVYVFRLISGVTEPECEYECEENHVNI